MKYYLKIFIVSFLGFSLLLSGGLYLVNQYNFLGAENLAQAPLKQDSVTNAADQPSTNLAQQLKASNRMNILLIGTDGGRSDTMMVFSYDHQQKMADIISIPRDTYIYIAGKEKAEQRKLNAVYGFKGDVGGAEGLKQEISKIIGIPIAYYVELDYQAVSKIVDTVGGVEVDIPYNLDYDDPYCKPPLHIHFKKGLQTLDGQAAMKYLRWRGNNDKSHSNGDLDRVKRQQDFVVLLSKKAIGFKLPFVINDVFSHLKTDLSLGDMLYLSTQVIGFDFASLDKHTLPGEAGMKFKTSYFFYDQVKTAELMQSIYDRTPAAVTANTKGEANGQNN